MVFNFRVCLFILAAVFCLTSCKKRELPVHEPVIKIDSINRGYLLGADNMQAGVNADLSPEYFCLNMMGKIILSFGRVVF